MAQSTQEQTAVCLCGTHNAFTLSDAVSPGVYVSSPTPETKVLQKQSKTVLIMPYAVILCVVMPALLILQKHFHVRTVVTFNTQCVLGECGTGYGPSGDTRGGW